MRTAALVAVVGVALLAALIAVRTRSRRSGAGDLAAIPPPWGDRPSIHAHVKAHLSPSGKGLIEGGERLPDEERAVGEGGLRWAPGALDGVMGHHVAGGEGPTVSSLSEAVASAANAPSAASVRHAYDLLAEDAALGSVDALLDSIVGRKDVDPQRLRAFARWLVEGAPDRGVVKIGLALLGLIQGDADRELFLTLGRHDEFTLYAAVALRNSLTEPDPALFELAKSVDGWGRIQTVERLRETKDPTIRRWLLREGFRNSIMYEYLAHLCATTGGLRAELEAPTVDDALLLGAGEILLTLVEGQGGPAEGMDDYADGASASRHFLRHLEARLPTAPLALLPPLDALVRFAAEEKADWEAREARGWTPEARREVQARGTALLASPRWRELVASGLASPDATRFREATAAAGVLGVDVWERQLERLAAGGPGGSWFAVCQTKERARMERAVALAERLLPLERIASGPALELGFGKEWQPHGDLDFVLQALDAFPGLGWTLVRAGLKSPLTRNRYMALRVLSAWGRDRWPSGAATILGEARAVDPDDKVREGMDRVLSGGPLSR